MVVEDVETDNAPLHVTGVIRDRNLDKFAAITVLFSGPIGDDGLREFHEYVSRWRVGGNAMASEAEVDAAARVLADTPTIDAPKLGFQCWMGTARAVLEAAERVRNEPRFEVIDGRRVYYNASDDPAYK